MVAPVIDEIAELVVEIEEQMVALDDEEVWEVNEDWLMAPVTPPPVPYMPSPSTYKVGGPSTAATEGYSLSLSAPGFPMPSSVIEDLCTHMGNLGHGHGLLVKKVIKVSDVEVADNITIGEIGPRVSAVEGQLESGTFTSIFKYLALKQLAIKQGDEYGFVIRPCLVGVTFEIREDRLMIR
ncbi:hypothetical protein Tco_0268525 [Tanacetum coccineum]